MGFFANNLKCSFQVIEEEAMGNEESDGQYESMEGVEEEVKMEHRGGTNRCGRRRLHAGDRGRGVLQPRRRAVRNRTLELTGWEPAYLSSHSSHLTPHKIPTCYNQRVSLIIQFLHLEGVLNSSREASKALRNCW